MSYKFGPPILVLGKPYTRLLDRDGKSPDADVLFANMDDAGWVRNVRRILDGWVRYEFKDDEGVVRTGRSPL